jgi:hypothetical protein
MYKNMVAEEIIEALSKAPKDYKVFQDSGWECGTASATIVFLDANQREIILANDSTAKNYLPNQERYKILGHGEEC